MNASPFAAVAVGRPVRGEFTYAVPESLQGQLIPGQRVLVPFGRGSALGFYLGPARAPDASVQVKNIVRALESEPALSEDLLSLLRFAAEHYRYPLGEVIKSALPPGMTAPEETDERAPPKRHIAVVQPGADPTALARAPAQAAALSYLLAVGGRADLEELAHAIPGARQTVKKLVERGWVTLVSEEIQPGVREGLEQARPEQLTPEQAASVDVLQRALGEGFQPFLLHGVTGSGKTEVYMRVVERALELGKGSLILVPEIALTPQLVGRFRTRFGAGVAVLHSGLKDRERLLHWQKLRKGDVKIAVGVRSAIFAPVPALGVVVVDEEHDGSFKQEDKLRYHARDLAVVRARQAGAVVILGSATPSLETLENVRKGRYRKLELNSRVDDRPLPAFTVVDMRLVRPRGPELPPEEPPILSAPLLQAMEEVLSRGQQVILFLNRRGHSTFLLCEVCGTRLRCSSCDVCLTHHKSMGRVMCHYCGDARPVPERCTECSGPLLMLGLGTERVEAEVADRFPQARVARLDRDAATTSERLTELLAAFARREIDILVGTQMVAKGHDFPGVTLVCVVLADTSLSIPDFRAAERTFQLLTQVGGRAGRGKDPGRVLLQTYNPESEPIKRVLARDFQGFSELELEWRRALVYPPYARMAAIRIEGAHPESTARTARMLAQRMARRLPPPNQGVRLLGPAPAPIARIKGKTRWQLLVKGPTHAALGPLLAEVESALPDVPSSIKVVIDVDPGTML